MKGLFRRLWEEPVLGAVFLVMIVRRIILPLAAGELLDYSLIGDGVEDLVVVMLGASVRQLVTPVAKRDRLNREAAKRSGAPRMAANPGERG